MARSEAMSRTIKPIMPMAPKLMMDIFTDNQNSLLFGLTDNLNILIQDLTKDTSPIRSTFRDSRLKINISLIDL